ncbi:MAG TPA: protein kinase [Thermoanaerobaculia bacterium]|nr:protein kinase [Thermoanaerobaculia bacterium]
MSLQTGTRLGVYEIAAPIGAGGMGEVYRARDTRLSREVAIKVLPAAVASDADRRLRFEQEARSASALNHPNILTIHDVGSADGTIYIAMELVEGKTLRELLAAGEPVPMKRLLEVATQTAEGLAKAHGAGIVHRDLKPENLMISKDGFVKILDFGLAKLIEPVTQDASVLPTAIAAPTTPGTVMGTAGYMSPEQASGQSVDYRSDQFTLGAILYEMATGKRAFARKTGAETLVAIIREEPEPIAQLAPKSPAPVRWIVDRLLAKDPEERYASTKDLARDLKSVRDHLSETTSSASGALETAEPARAKRRGWFLPAALALLIGAAGAALVIRKLDLFQPPPLQFQRLTFRRGAVGAARFAQDGRTVAYSASWDGGPTEVYSTAPESPESKSLGLPPANLFAASSTGELAIGLGWRRFGGWEGSGTLARVPLAGGAPREVVENVQDADWSPDGKQLAVVNHAGARARLEYPVGTVMAESSGWIDQARISPDGRNIAFYDHPERGENAGRLIILDVAKKRRTEGPFVPGTAGLVWTRDGDVLITGGPSRLLRVSPSGKIRNTRGLGVGFVPEDLSRDGTLLAKHYNWRREMVGLAPAEDRERNLTWLDWSFPNTLSADGTTVLFDEQDRPRGEYLCYVRRTDGSAAVLLGQAKGLDLSPDKRWALTTNTAADELTLIPTAAGSPKKIAKANLTYQLGEFFPDGKTILLWGNEPGRASRLYVQGVDEARPRPITREGFGLSAVGGRAISPDGRAIGVRGIDGRVYIIPTDGSTEPRLLPGAHVDEISWGWTEDGKSIYVAATGSMPLRIELCDVATGERRLWKEIVPPDPAGVLAIGPIYIAADGRSYIYSYRRQLDELFLIKGVQ